LLQVKLVPADSAREFSGIVVYSQDSHGRSRCEPEMPKHDPRKPAQDPVPPKLSCRECHAEIPPEEAFVSESTEYAFYFCGVGCYDEWRKRAEEEMSPRESRRKSGWGS
jgi:hypothetical protein